MCVCMYVYVCMHVCMYVCTYIRKYICMYVCMYVYVCTMCVCVCVCMYAYMYVCVYIYIHTHTHTYRLASRWLDTTGILQHRACITALGICPLSYSTDLPKNFVFPRLWRANWIFAFCFVIRAVCMCCG